MDWIVDLATAKTAPIPEGARSALLMRHGTMTLRYYQPRGSDPQTPHDQDEIYIVATGRGTVVSGPSEASSIASHSAPATPSSCPPVMCTALSISPTISASGSCSGDPRVEKRLNP